MTKRVFFAVLVLGMSVAVATAAIRTNWVTWGSLDKGNDASNPGIDVYDVKCMSAANPLRASVMAGGNDGAIFRVSVLCVDPVNRRGSGDHEIAFFPDRTISEWAEAPGCLEALISVTCDRGTPCTDGDYSLELDCVGVGIRSWSNGEYFKPTINR